MAASYRWIITKVNLEGQEHEVGTSGPRNMDSNLESNPEHFSVYDDDHNCYAEGMLYSTDEAVGTELVCSAPLDEFATANWGCVLLKLTSPRFFGASEWIEAN